MAEIEEEIKFDIVCQSVTLTTKPTKDSISLSGIQLTKGQAASMAWLINNEPDTLLEVEIKVKEV